jgi:hypothetical protein
MFLSIALLFFSKIKKKGPFLALTGLIILSFAPICQALSPLDAVINEISWMGTETSSNDEWIELKNNTSGSLDLTGWRLEAADGNPKIFLSGFVEKNGFYLLERTDDKSVQAVPANIIYSGALSNTGEALSLYDQEGNLIDQVDCSTGWFAGDNKTKQTMERKDAKGTGSDPKNWINSQSPGGSPQNTAIKDTPPKNNSPATTPTSALMVKTKNPSASLLPKEESNNFLVAVTLASVFSILCGASIFLLKKFASK